MKPGPRPRALSPSPEGPELERLLETLRTGTLSLYGLLPWSSNYTFLGQVDRDDQAVLVVYKPIRGERPLWDFPRGTLAKREVAAYIVSRALGWDLVPPTVLRSGPDGLRSGPHGPGSVQLFTDVDQDAHFFTFQEDPVFRSALQRLALFDAVVNNADRKAGHCLKAGVGRILAIDHGICFNVEPKLRTVVWDFAGQPIPPDLAADLRRFQASLNASRSPLVGELAGLLSAAEIVALKARLAALLAAGRFPEPPGDRPAIPWPPV